MKRLYKIQVPGTHADCDALLTKCTRLGIGPVGGSGVLGPNAFVQLWRESDDEAILTAQVLLGYSTSQVSTGYGIHRRVVFPPDCTTTLV